MRERLPTTPSESGAEAISVSEKITHEYLHVDPEKIAAFKMRAARNQGHARVSVHPLYLLWHPHPDMFWDPGASHTQEDAKQHLMEGFERTIHNVLTQPESAPLLIFEEHAVIEKTKEIISTLFGEKVLDSDGILFFETENGSGFAYPEYAESIFDSLFPQIEPSCAELRKKIIELEEEKVAFETTIPEPDKTLYDAYKKDPMSISNSDRDRLNVYFKKIGNINLEMVDVYDTLGERASEISLMPHLTTALGISSVTAMGAYMKFDDNRFYGCLENVIHQLNEANVPTNISRYTWTKRDTLKQQGYDTKQKRKET